MAPLATQKDGTVSEGGDSVCRAAIERQEGRINSTFRHVMPVDNGSEGTPETVMDLKRLRAHQRQALVDRGVLPSSPQPAC